MNWKNVLSNIIILFCNNLKKYVYNISNHYTYYNLIIKSDSDHLLFRMKYYTI